jgi:hypothetical protein
MKLDVVKFNVSPGEFLFLFLFSASLFLNYSLCSSCSFSSSRLASPCFRFCSSINSYCTSSFCSSLNIVSCSASSNFFFSICLSRFYCIVSFTESAFSTPLAGDTGFKSLSSVGEREFEFFLSEGYSIIG